MTTSPATSNPLALTRQMKELFADEGTWCQGYIASRETPFDAPEQIYTYCILGGLMKAAGLGHKAESDCVYPIAVPELHATVMELGKTAAELYPKLVAERALQPTDVATAQDLLVTINDTDDENALLPAYWRKRPYRRMYRIITETVKRLQKEAKS